jgi:copper transport protein
MVTATFPLSPPPRAEAGLPSPAAVVATSQGRRATFTLVPGQAGAHRLEAHIVDAAGEPVAAAEATLRVSLPEAGIEPSRYRLEPVGPGRFATTLDLPRPGRWRLRLDLLVDDFTKLILEAELDLAAG